MNKTKQLFRLKASFGVLLNLKSFYVRCMSFIGVSAVKLLIYSNIDYLCRFSNKKKTKLLSGGNKEFSWNLSNPLKIFICKHQSLHLDILPNIFFLLIS